MRKDWIIDVLADLRAFAEHNGLDATAAGLEDAALVAVAEIASHGRRGTTAPLAIRVPEASSLPANVTDLFAHRRPY